MLDSYRSFKLKKQGIAKKNSRPSFCNNNGILVYKNRVGSMDIGKMITESSLSVYTNKHIKWI